MTASDALTLPRTEAGIPKPAPARRSFDRVFIYTAIAILALVFVAPIVTMVLTSLKSMDEIRAGNLFALPHSPSLDAWSTVWNSACIGVQCDGLKGHFLVSILLVIPAVFFSVSLGALNGYVLTKWRFRGANVVFGLILFGCFIPFQSVLIPMANLLGLLHVAGTVPGLVLVHVIYGIPFTTLFFRNYFVSVPNEIMRAARVDGAGFWSILLRILLPISWPIVMVSVIWQFTGIWNDFLFGVAFSSGTGQPITVALNNLVNTSTGTKAYNEDMAAAIVTALPTIMIYVLAGRYFVRGLMAGSVKG